MIQRVLHLQPALERLFALGKRDFPKFVPFELSDEEWDMVQTLASMLSVFVEPTVRMCKEKTSTLHMQLPWFHILLDDMAAMLKKLGGTKEAKKNPSGLASACLESWRVLNEYWNITDQH